MDNNQSMDIDEGQDRGRVLIRDRFEKVEKARPAVPRVLWNAHKRQESMTPQEENKQ